MPSVLFALVILDIGSHFDHVDLDRDPPILASHLAGMTDPLLQSTFWFFFPITMGSHKLLKFLFIYLFFAQAELGQQSSQSQPPMLLRIAGICHCTQLLVEMGFCKLFVWADIKQQSS
jgi:hypothetical protein